MASEQAKSFRRETITKTVLPATGYLGAAVVLMFKGKEVVVMAADHESVIQVVREMRPSMEIDEKAIYPVCLMHERHVNTEEEEL
jgi:hypothetical protein